jgi:cytochrome c oxidase subunit 4
MSEHIVAPRTYVTVYILLVMFTFLTAGVAYFDLGVFNPVVALTIAIVKAALVVLIFMHAYYGSRLIWIVGGTALFWLGIMFVLTMSDYLTRGWAYY